MTITERLTQARHSNQRSAVRSTGPPPERSYACSTCSPSIWPRAAHRHAPRSSSGCPRWESSQSSRAVSSPSATSTLCGPGSPQRSATGASAAGRFELEPGDQGPEQRHGLEALADVALAPAPQLAGRGGQAVRRRRDCQPELVERQPMETGERLADPPRHRLADHGIGPPERAAVHPLHHEVGPLERGRLGLEPEHLGHRQGRAAAPRASPRTRAPDRSSRGCRPRCAGARARAASRPRPRQRTRSPDRCRRRPARRRGRPRRARGARAAAA